MSSFFKRMFGYGEQAESSNNISTGNDPIAEFIKLGTHNNKRCKSIVAPYNETTEDKLKIDNSSLFNEDELDLEKLRQAFIDSIKIYKPNLYKEFVRIQESNKNGGIDFNNPEITSIIRSTGTDVIKQVGKKLLSGDFNLTTISFPIKVMIPITMVQACAYALFQFPYYMHLAQEKDVVERLKYTIVATLSPFFCSSFFLKPLNPVLGETFEGYFEDGSKFYVEQSSHHPPISHYEVYGPGNSYYYCGYSQFSSSAGLNTLYVNNKGKRYMKFKDGVRFDFDFYDVSY